jgi:hypothetical protein
MARRRVRDRVGGKCLAVAEELGALVYSDLRMNEPLLKIEL